MQVTNITVGYDRKRQPAQYESSGASVSFSATSSATVGDTEDYVEVARKLLGEAKTLVLTELGLVAPGKSASAHDLVPAQGQQAGQQAGGDAGAGAGAAGAAAGDKKTTTRKPKPAEAAKPAEAPKPADGNDIPDDGARQISTGGERKDPAQGSGSDIPDDAPANSTATATGDKVTHAELMAYISRQIADKKIDHNSVKALTATFNKPRIAEVAETDLAKYKAMLDAKIAELNPADGL